MHELAFNLAIAGFLVLVASLPIRIFSKEKWLAWGAVVIAFNFLSQGYMVLKDITFPFIAIPNIVLFGYLVFCFIKMYSKDKQK